MFKLEFIVLIYCATICYAGRQQITFYTEVGCTGEGLILESKQSHLVPEAPRIISSYKSTLGFGAWQIYYGVNFTSGSGGSYWATIYEAPYCHNVSSSPAINSARYLGSPDTRTNSLSLYDETAYRGREITITEPESASFPFLPKSIFTTGAMNWTFYDRENFGGTAICFIPRSNNWYDGITPLNATLSYIRSIARGCERQIDHFIYGGNEKEGIFES